MDKTDEQAMKRAFKRHPIIDRGRLRQSYGQLGIKIAEADIRITKALIGGKIKSNKRTRLEMI